MSSWSNILNSLNPAQRKAVESPDGHLLIDAAAGTGKTRTLAARILYLQKEMDIPSGAILGLSFSRSARQQLINRMKEMGWEAGGGSSVKVFTFHGLSHNVIRLAITHGETWLKNNFEIVSTGRGGISPVFERNFDELAKGIVKTSSRSFRVGKIGPFKENGGTDMVERLGYINSDIEVDWHHIPEVAVLVWAKGLDMLRQGHPELGRAMLSPEEVPDGRLLTIFGKFSARLQVNTSVLKTIWHRYNRILRRENIIDYPGLVVEAVRILRNESSIAASRIREGLRYILVDEYQDTSMAQEALLFTLAGRNTNMNVVGDSRQAIYTFNGSEISNILEFSKRAILTGKKVLEPISLTWNYRSTPNILLLANRIVSRLEYSGANGSICNLEPAHCPLHGDAEDWRKRNLAVKRVYAPRLELAADFISTEIKRLLDEEKIPPGQIAVLVRKNSEFSPQASIVKEYLISKGIPLAEETSPEKTAEQIQSAITICQHYYNDNLKDLIALLENPNECISIPELEGIYLGGVASLLREVWESGVEKAWGALDILQDMIEENSDELDSQNCVSVKTVHSAKGAEYRVVFLLYLGDRSFPHGRRHDPDEERRLFYVGITRAMERLYLLGVPGLHYVNFFGESDGEGTCKLDWIVPGGQEAFYGQGLDKNIVDNIEEARRRQQEEEDRKKRLLSEWLDGLD